MYNAIAGSCAEQEANAGGGGSPPPAGIAPPNQIYTAISNGGAVGFTVHTLGINFAEFFSGNTPTNIVTAFNGNQTTNASMNITNLTDPLILNGEFFIKLQHTMPASAFNSLFGTGFTTSSGSTTHIDEVIFLFGWYLESPNGTATLSHGNIDIMGASQNMTGMGLFAKTTRSQVGQTYPLIDSTSFTNASEAFIAQFSGSGVTSDSHLGSNGVVTVGNTTVFVQGDTHCICSLRNFAGRSGGTPSATAGQGMTIQFRIASSIGGNQERTHFFYELLLT